MAKHILTAFVLFLAFFCSNLYATHIRAADISAEKISATRYKIILKVYTDYANVKDNSSSNNPIDVEKLKIGFGDQKAPLAEINITRKSVTEIVPNETFENIYETVYDFPSTNNGYKIYFVGENRNSQVVNIPSSVDKKIYIETFVYIDGFSPLNTTPKFTVPPIDVAAVNRIYTHNPGAYDANGDSLSFELILPRDNSTTNLGNIPVGLTMDPKTGQIIWNTPKTLGEYNIAYRVNEYRDGVRIGYVVRDMQINVLNSNNNPPIIQIAKDTCISTSVNYTDIIRASDPDRDAIKVELYGTYKELGGNADIFDITPDVKQIRLNWIPDCNAVRKQPVQGLVKANDILNAISLSTFATWNIQVIGQKPQLTSVIPNGNKMKVSWEKYPCSTPSSKILIYRAECDTSKIMRSACTTGVPKNWGFMQVGEANIDDTNFEDGALFQLTSGVKYYYMIVAQFGVPSFSESYASNVEFASLNQTSPIITQISFDKRTKDKTLLFSWDYFFEIDKTIYRPNYTYVIKNNGNIIETKSSNNIVSQTISIDTLKLNLKENIVLEVFDGANKLIGNQSVAIAERLKVKGTDKALDIQWTNSNAWLYPDSLNQKIYFFKANGDTTKIAEVKGGVTNYKINGLKNGDSVCAFVETAFVYCIDGIDSVFTSFTNTDCALVQDNIAPCPPDLSLLPINCALIPLGNQLSWGYTQNILCNKDISKFEIYKKEFINKGDFISLVSLDAKSVDYLDIAGGELNCYYIKAIDSSGNYSIASNTVCQDFCGDVLFPNIFTPNSDGKNDFFSSKTNFSGYENTLFYVVNRWGKEVYRKLDFTEINWDGKSSSGEELSDGVYFFFVSGVRLTGNKGKMEYKSWLTLIR